MHEHELIFAKNLFQFPEIYHPTAGDALAALVCLRVHVPVLSGALHT